MKRLNKHTISIILMCSSIGLLLLFQYFWLRKVYEEQRTWLQKEADNLLQNSIITLQDSIFQGKMQAAVEQSEDTATSAIARQNSELKADTFIFISKDEMRVVLPGTKHYNEKDSIFSDTSMRFKERSNAVFFRRNRADRFNIRFPISPDSMRAAQLNKTLQRIVMNVKNRKGTQEVVIKLSNDSLPTAAVQRTFAQKLMENDLPIQFEILKTTLPEMPKAEGALLAGPVPGGIPPRDMYAAKLLNYDRYLFTKTFPQLLFSLFLIGITSLAFWLVYKSLRQQQRLTALKNDFISNITHELKTPIATVSVAIEALSNFNALQNPQLTKEYLDISRNELNRLTILVDKVLRMSIFEQKEPELRLEHFNLAELVSQIIASMRLQFEKYDAQVAFDTNGADFTVEADRLHLTSVVYNLIDNALKYSPEAPKIDIHLEQQNGHINLMVEDNGIGIAPEYRSRIFEKFFRVPTGDVHNVKGYGLGLNYVSSVVKKHGGKIEVESEPGRGSCFKVTLPRKD